MKKTMAALALLMCMLPAAASADVWLKDKPDQKLTGEVTLSGENVELVGDGQPTDVWFVGKEETKEITFENVCAQADGIVLEVGGMWSVPLKLTFAGEQASSLTSRTTHAVKTGRILTVEGSGAVIQGGSGEKGGSGIQGMNGDVTISASNIAIRGGNVSAAGSSSSSFVSVDGGHGIYTNTGDVTISGSNVEISGGALDAGSGFNYSAWGGHGVYMESYAAATISGSNVRITGGNAQKTGYSGTAHGGYGVYAQSGSATISGSDVEISGGDARNNNFYAEGGTGVWVGRTLTIHDAGVAIRGGEASGHQYERGGTGVFVNSEMDIIGDAAAKGVTICGGAATSGKSYSNGGWGVSMRQANQGMTISSENVLIRGGNSAEAMYNASVTLAGVAGFESEDGTKWAQDETGTQGDLPWYKTGPIPQANTSALPKTGDRSSLTLWAALLAASACALSLRRRRAA